MNPLKEKLKPYRSIVSNFTSLSVLQISNYLFPLILLPYLVRVLGAEKYGLISFALAFNSYFVTLCDYGFNYSGTRAISVSRHNIERISSTFSSIILIKLILFFLSFVILLFVVFTFNRFSSQREVFMLASGMVLGNVLFPLWFYQGMEKMKYISIIQIPVRLCYTILVFILVVNASDYILYLILFSASQVLTGLSGLVAAILKFNIRLRLPGTPEIKFHLKDGWNIFLSMISINIYTISNIFILGLFTSDAVVGYFTAADKIRLAFQSFISTISQTVYPHINHLLKKSSTEFTGFIRKLFSLTVITGFVISLILFLFAEFLVEIILGSGFNESVIILQILSPLPFLIALSNIFGIQIMLPLGFDKQFNRILFAAALLHIILLFLLIQELLAVGASISMGITEAFVTSVMFIFVFKKVRVPNKNV